MKRMYYLCAAFIFSLCLPFLTEAQTANFNVNNYKQFLMSHENMTYDNLTAMHSAGVFKGNVHVDYESAAYFDSIDVKYHLTTYEKSLLSQNGFMVSERLADKSFGEAFLQIFQNDLPVFISTDAILHAFHMSYDEILKNVELNYLINNIENLLTQLHQKMPVLAAKYSSDSEMTQMLKDVDIYLTVPLMLLGENVQPYYSDNSSKINDILTMINSEQGSVAYSLFSNNCVTYDWSQFKPRGHYTDSNHPILAKYFKAMMWLGRIGIYLLPPTGVSGNCPPQSFKDIQRQTIDAMLIAELFDDAGVYPLYKNIEDVLKYFVGEQDNVTLPNLYYLRNAVNINNASSLLDSLELITFQDTLKNQAFANQKILSQIIAEDPMQPDSIVPASAFLLFGQRFVIDSYITASVVYDRIRYNGTTPCRLNPSSLDVMFSLGNNASAQLLKDQITKYHYASNLASLRYLIDSYSNSFWNLSLYNKWLNFIRELNPPTDRSSLPLFMQTGAFWQEKLNTQLASWAELRHDNLLYAKQSYTGSPTCSYPYAYLEPFPEFYNSLKIFADSAQVKFSKFNFANNTNYNIVNYFKTLSGIADTLTLIARNELTDTPMDSAETSFLKSVMYENPTGVCGELPFSGWYARMFYNYYMPGFNNATTANFIVADIHTVPTDCMGNTVGWVDHVGTGFINLGVFVTKTCNGNEAAYIGPVMSYHEYTTTNFNRLTDEEWQDSALASSLRPDWVNAYLANQSGETLGSGTNLITSVKENNLNDKQQPTKFITAQNYPNPFNPSTIISFKVPKDLSGSFTQLVIYDLQGQRIKTLINRWLPANNYLTRWDGTNERGQQVSSGIYIYHLKIGSMQFNGKMSLIK